jgi:inhibitor of KinA
MNTNPAYTIFPLGDSALSVDFGNVIDSNINNKVLALFHKLKEAALPGVMDIVPAYSSLAIHYNMDFVVHNSSPMKTAYERMARKAEEIIAEGNLVYTGKRRLVQVPVCYAEPYALDLAAIAAQKGMTTEEVIQVHSAPIYTVYMIGFLPGFAYMGKVDQRIVVPRQPQPRKSVVAGSVGIAGEQTGIYPVTTPGGWQIIGRTPLLLFNKAAAEPVLFQPGDEVQFYSITVDEFENY